MTPLSSQFLTRWWMRMAVWVWVALNVCPLQGLPTVKDTSSTTSTEEVALRRYLAEVHDDVSQSGAYHQLWKSGGEFGGDVPGGFLEKISLPVNGKESILLLRSSLDERLAPSQTNPPMPETFRVFVSPGRGEWVAQKIDKGGIVAGHWTFVRERKQRYHYGVHWGVRDTRPHIEVYTALDGKLLLVERKLLPSQEDILDKHDSMDETQFKKWVKIATAPPSGMNSFAPKRQWIRLTDLVRNPSFKWQWQEGEPPQSAQTDANDEVTFEAFARWLGK